MSQIDLKSAPPAHSCLFFARNNSCPNIYVPKALSGIGFYVWTLHKWYILCRSSHLFFSLKIVFLRFFHFLCGSSSGVLRVCSGNSQGSRKFFSPHSCVLCVSAVQRLHDTWCHNRLNTEAFMGIQLSSLKPIFKKIWRNVK